MILEGYYKYLMTIAFRNVEGVINISFLPPKNQQSFILPSTVIMHHHIFAKTIIFVVGVTIGTHFSTL